MSLGCSDDGEVADAPDARVTVEAFKSASENGASKSSWKRGRRTPQGRLSAMESCKSDPEGIVTRKTQKESGGEW